MKQTAKAIVLFEVVTFEADMRRNGRRDRGMRRARAARRVDAAELASNAAEINEICLQITRIEGNADDMHDRGLERLYQKAKAGDAMEFIRGNEIYNHLENTVDRLDDVADEIQGIVIEHA